MHFFDTGLVNYLSCYSSPEISGNGASKIQKERPVSVRHLWSVKPPV